MRVIKVGDVFTEQELDKALKIWRGDRSQFHYRVMTEIVKPAMPRINATTGQENLEAYLAYVLEYAVSLTAGN